VETNRNVYKVQKEFRYTDEFFLVDGNVPVTGLALTDTTLYGTTAYGGKADWRAHNVEQHVHFSIRKRHDECGSADFGKYQPIFSSALAVKSALRKVKIF
jgi:hypothetical protein